MRFATLKISLYVIWISRSLNSIEKIHSCDIHPLWGWEEDCTTPLGAMRYGGLLMRWVQNPILITALKAAHAILQITFKTGRLQCNSHTPDGYSRLQYGAKLYKTNSYFSQALSKITLWNAPQCHRTTPCYSSFPKTTNSIQLTRAGHTEFCPFALSLPGASH